MTESKEWLLHKRAKIYGNKSNKPPIVNTGVVFDKVDSSENNNSNSSNSLNKSSNKLRYNYDYLKNVIIEGRYAVNDPSDEILKFYKVDIPKEGKYVGYLFLSVQASYELFSIKNSQHRYKILCEIAKDPIGAMMRYGREIGSCAICGRTLTDQESRDRGIGPICAGKMGLL